MRKMLLAICLVLMLAVPAFATNWGDTYNDYDYTITNQGGQGGAGGAATANPVITNTNTANGGAGGSAIVGDVSATGGNATIQSGAVKVDNKNTNTNLNTNLNSNVNSNKIDNKNSNIQGQSQGQLQGQTQKQGQGQGQAQEINNGQTISPSQSISIVTEKPLLGYGIAVVPELNFGSGRFILDIDKALPKFGIPLLTVNDTVKEVLDITANVKFKSLYKTVLKMKKDQMPLCYNVRMQIVMVEGQKSWTTGGSLSGGGAGGWTQSGASAGTSLVPSIGATKAQPLFTIVLVKIS